MSGLPGVEGELPLQKSVDASELPLKVVVDPVKPVDPEIPVAPEGGACSRNGEVAWRMTSIAQLLERLNQGLAALKDLNLQGFRQIYPVFLILFGALPVCLHGIR